MPQAVVMLVRWVDLADPRKASDHYWANVFPDAHAHIQGRENFRWHESADAKNSSQALCLSVWGTLARRRKRTAILREIYEAAGISEAVSSVDSKKP
jgi:hypothetical protein